MSSTVNNLSNMLNNTYPVFEPNQLLTSSHLNQLRNYLDIQDRISRVRLVGMGIVCGLEVTYEDNKITISSGTGITSEGFLVHLEEETFTKASEAEYADPEEYPLFDDPVDSMTGQIPMWELLPESTQVSPTLALTQGAMNINEKVVVLFVEYHDIDLESCVGQNCDDRGQKRTFTIRKLLMNCEDVDKFIRSEYQIPFSNAMSGDDSLNGSFNARFDQSYMVMPSFTLVPNGLPIKDYPVYYENLKNAADIQQRYQVMYPDSPKNPFFLLGEKIYHAYRRFEPFLQGLVNESTLLNLKTRFKSQYAAYNSQGILQYFYDYGKDLAKAYNEFVDLAFEITAECNPSENLFPRHLILGKVTTGNGCPENEDPCRPKVYRTHFIQSPIYNQQKDQIKEVRNAFKRLVVMIESLQLKFSGSDELRLTPSNEKQAALQDRSIPYYYEPKPLYHYWNYNLSKKCKSNWNLGYWAEKFDQVPPSSKFPLRFDKDPYNFYRIEGLIGKNHKEICQQLEVLKRQYDLDFDILAVKMRPNNTLEEMFKVQAFQRQSKLMGICGNSCESIDLKEDYLQLRNEIIHYLSNVNAVMIETLKMVLDQVGAMQTVVQPEKKTEGPNLENYVDGIGGLLEPIKNVIKAIPVCLEEFNFFKFEQLWRTLSTQIFLMTYLFESFIRAAGAIGVFMIHYFNRALFAAGYPSLEMKDLYQFLNSDVDLKLGSVFFSHVERLKQQEQNRLFSTFVKKNPGIEHMAGVPKGGTFIMIYGEDGIPERDIKTGKYISKSTFQERVFADFALQGKVCCDEKFAFCQEEKPIYPPIARTIYVFITEYEQNQTIDIDIRNHILDFNVKAIGLTEMDQDATSNLGMPISIGKIDGTDVDVIKYTMLARPPFDTFEYTIHHQDNPQITATGYVIVASLNALEPFNLCLKSCDQAGQTHQTHGGSVVLPEGVPSGVDETDDDIGGNDNSFASNETFTFYQPEYSVNEGLNKAMVFNNMTAADNDFASNKIKETRLKYEALKKNGALAADASATDKAAFEIELINQLKTVMKETSDGIDAYNKLIGSEPEDLTDKLIQRVQMSDKIAARDALVLLYDDQTDKLMNILESQDLGKDEKGAVYKFIDNDVRSHLTKMGTSGIITKKKLAKRGEIDLENAVRKDLFNSYKL